MNLHIVITVVARQLVSLLIFHGLKNMQGLNLFFLLASLMRREMLFVDPNPIISSTSKDSFMFCIYDLWKKYALFVIDAVSAYCRNTEHLPFVVSLGGLLLPLLAAGWFLPRWASLSIYAAICLPLAWFLGCMIGVFINQGPNRN
ncbi:hypothetical protein [Methylobacter sp. YRD-M1]|uniref:hypothetical protein n=1 Tax=Methylobacter sp. YRD-M1 TaxID=2911520 RepID=UPI00227BF0E3|nr:hypothetical protein [Methylobacter sp. YRD-M1]WAK04327.1 hypothetical protein LZ558_21915 [Methylobacter sp. YRD-M1]